MQKMTKVPKEISNDFVIAVDWLSDKAHLNSLRAGIASLILKGKIKRCVTPEDFVDLCYNSPLKYCGWSIVPQQIKEEILELLQLLCKKQIRAMLEIGTANGGTLFLFAKVIEPEAKIISLDLPGGNYGGGYEDFRMPLYTNFARKNQRIFLVRDDSEF